MMRSATRPLEASVVVPTDDVKVPVPHDDEAFVHLDKRMQWWSQAAHERKSSPSTGNTAVVHSLNKLNGVPTFQDGDFHLQECLQIEGDTVWMKLHKLRDAIRRCMLEPDVHSLDAYAERHKPHIEVGGNLANAETTAGMWDSAVERVYPGSLPEGRIIFGPKGSRFVENLRSIQAQGASLDVREFEAPGFQRTALHFPFTNTRGKRETIMWSTPSPTPERLADVFNQIMPDGPEVEAMFGMDIRRYIQDTRRLCRQVLIPSANSKLHFSPEDLICLNDAELGSILGDSWAIPGAFDDKGEVLPCAVRAIDTYVQKHWGNNNLDGSPEMVASIGLRNGAPACTLSVYHLPSHHTLNTTNSGALLGIQVSISPQAKEEELFQASGLPQNDPLIDSTGRGDAKAGTQIFFRRRMPNILEAHLRDSGKTLTEGQKFKVAVVATEALAVKASALVGKSRHASLIGVPTENLGKILSDTLEESIEAVMNVRIHETADVHHAETFSLPHSKINGVLWKMGQ